MQQMCIWSPQHCDGRYGAPAALPYSNPSAKIRSPTVRFAVLLAGPAAGVSVAVTPEVVFGYTPIVLLVTEKTTVQLPFAGIVIPEKASAVDPAPNVLGVVPAQVPVTAPADLWLANRQLTTKDDQWLS